MRLLHRTSKRRLSGLPFEISIHRPLSSTGQILLASMSNHQFKFVDADGWARPAFDIDLAAVQDLAGLKQAIGTNFGVVRSEGKHRKHPHSLCSLTYGNQASPSIAETTSWMSSLRSRAPPGLFTSE